ncbi:TetR/AcrR family transcriptional regulator [Amycolatopsis nigrescens]|uniref:TetR/AcrR family transcriptional regulator n=1 Tax=Amycolatopsis nigrescens TaxID=381445 RepID=UPI00036DD160|nr:TetR/AcrR family transcriptional regulator C-terminal domain-containing protein [Amycolatopsis nigrescens]
MPRPRSLTHAGIAAAALAVIDRDGLAALSMRAVAVELGMGTMSLYRYVEDREQLEALVVDKVLGEVDTVAPSRGPWPKRVTALVERMRDVAGAHPQLAPLLMAHRDRSAASWHWTESVLGVLTEAGFTGRNRVIAFRTVLSYLFGSLQAELLGPLSGAGTATLAALSPEDFPLLSETATAARRLGDAESFRRGLAAVLRGLDPTTG